MHQSQAVLRVGVSLICGNPIELCRKSEILRRTASGIAAFAKGVCDISVQLRILFLLQCLPASPDCLAGILRGVTPEAVHFSEPALGSGIAQLTCFPVVLQRLSAVPADPLSL